MRDWALDTFRSLSNILFQAYLAIATLLFFSYNPLWGGSDCTFRGCAVHLTAIDLGRRNVWSYDGRIVEMSSLTQYFCLSMNSLNLITGKSLPAKGKTQLGPVLTDIFLSCAFTFSYTNSICYQYVYCRSTPRWSQIKGHISTLTHLVYLNFYYRLCAICTPVCFSAKTKTIKTNSDFWFGWAYPYIYKRGGIMVRSGTTSRQIILPGIFDL